MTTPDAMPIGAFARRTGLTASALRFYADAGLLPPAYTDTVSGYRMYTDEQVDRAVTLRQLREMAMPLPRVREVLDASPSEAMVLVDEHVAMVVDDAAHARRQAAGVKSRLAVGCGDGPGVRLRGPVLASAIEQVLTATTVEPEMAMLNTVCVEVTGDGLTMAATDRYRLVVRTLALTGHVGEHWSAALHVDDLRTSVTQIRRSPDVELVCTATGVQVITSAGEYHCRTVDNEFPDYRTMLETLAPAVTRVTIVAAELLRALERSSPHVTIRVGSHGVQLLDDDDVVFGTVTASATGPDIELRFELITLYPAIAGSVGGELLIDIRAADQPVTIRSADHGDLTVLAMPIPSARR